MTLRCKGIKLLDKIQIRICKDFAEYKAGTILDLDSREGIPVSPYWQRRMRDAALDDCCELVVANKEAKRTKTNADKGAK